MYLNPTLEIDENLESGLSAEPSNALSESSNISNQHRSSGSSPISKRSRQLKLNGSTRGNELTEDEKISIDKSLIKMIVNDYQPLSLVKNTSFLEFTKKLQPLYKPPSRKTLTTKLISDEYNKIVATLKSMLENISDLSITTDMWTSDSNRAYITVTSHFIFNDHLYSPVIATREMREAHTGLNIATLLSNILIEWGIKDKIVTIVSDNGANIKNAINEHLCKHHHPCVAHT